MFKENDDKNHIALEFYFDFAESLFKIELFQEAFDLYCKLSARLNEIGLCEDALSVCKKGMLLFSEKPEFATKLKEMQSNLQKKTPNPIFFDINKTITIE